MKIRFSFNPSGEFLMNFCYINLWSFENEISLLSKRNLADRIQYYFVKRRIKRTLQLVSKSIYKNNNFEFDSILMSINDPRSDIYDNLLSHIVIKQVVTWASRDNYLNSDERLNTVLSIFLQWINEFHGQNEEILMMKIEMIKVQTQMDLLIASAKSDNRGQFE